MGPESHSRFGVVAVTFNRSSRLNLNVVAMSATSLFSDASHEAATAVLPGFLARARVAAVRSRRDRGPVGRHRELRQAGLRLDRRPHRQPLAARRIGYSMTGLMPLFLAIARHMASGAGREVARLARQGNPWPGPRRDAGRIGPTRGPWPRVRLPSRRRHDRRRHRAGARSRRPRVRSRRQARNPSRPFERSSCSRSSRGSSPP